MNKWLSLILAVISVASVYAGEGAVKVASPRLALILANHQAVTGKSDLPRSPKASSPRCYDIKAIVPGQVLPHKQLVRTESELKIIVTDKLLKERKLSKSSSGSSLALGSSTNASEETELEENATQVPTTGGRRNTISS